MTTQAHILTETAREALRYNLIDALQAYDTDQYKRLLSTSKRKVYYNNFALGLYIDCLDRAMTSLTFEGVTVEMALTENFGGYLLKSLLKTYAKMLPKGGN